MHIDRGSNACITILHLFAYHMLYFLILLFCAQMIILELEFCILLYFSMRCLPS